MSAFSTSSPDLAALQNQLLGRFEQFRRRVRAHLVVEGGARVLAEIVGLALLSFVLDRVFRLGLGFRVVYVLLSLALVVWETFRHVIRPLRLQLSPVDLATAIDRHRSGASVSLAARVAAVLQLPDLLQHERPPSEPFVRRAVQRSYESLQAENFSDALDDRRRNLAAGAIAALVLLPVLLSLAFPFSAKLWAKRWMLGSSDAWPQKTYLTVADLRDGVILVPRGEPHVLRVGVKPGSVEPENVSLTLRIAGGRKTTASMSRFGPGDFRFDLPPLTNDATVELSGGDDEFGPFGVQPVDRPRVVDLVLSSQHPTQKAAEIHHFSGVDAEMSFLPKTRLELTVVSNVPVAEVKLKSQSPKPGMNELRRLSDRSFALAWTHESPAQLTFELIGTVGDLASVPTPVSIGLKVDQAPRVSIQYTGVRQRITPQAHVPLNIQSRDDYSLVKVELATRSEPPISLGESTTKPTTAPSARESSIVLLAPTTRPSTLQLEVQHKHEFDVSKENLSPGSLVSFTARATDDCYTGAQTGSSRTVTFRIVAPEELFRDILLRQQAERAKFRKTISDSEKLRADLISLSSPDAASALARQHRVTQREVTRIATALGESVVEMRLNGLGGPEAWALMENGILKPLKTLNDGFMSEQRDALDALTKNIDPKKLAEAGNRQDEIVSKMNDVLKQMSQWDSFVDVINQLNEIIKLQDNVKNNTEKLKETQTQGVFDK